MSPPKANAKHTQPGTRAAARLNQAKSKPRQADSAQAPERSQAAGRLANDELNALLQCTHGDPFAVLGMHAVEGSIVVRALLPSALEVELIDAAGRQLGTLARQDDSALFTALIPRQRQPFAYRLRVLWACSAGQPSQRSEIEDAYRFGPQLAELDVWLLAEGTHQRPYEWLGAHPVVVDEIGGTRFAVWAPGARRVSVVGSFNDWDGRRHMMRLRRECGVWEIFVPHAAAGDLYKYEVLGADDVVRVKADPFAFRAEVRPQTASVVQRLLPGVAIDDERRRANALDAPISIYEVHLGSWQRNA